MFGKSTVFVVTLIAIVGADHLFNQHKFVPSRSSAACGSSVGSKCYRVICYMKANWYGAHIHCNSLGMRLAIVESEEQQHELERQMESNSCGKECLWIGATNYANGKDWFWAATGEPVTYNAWLPKRPNCKGEQRCMEQTIDKVRGWNDRHCTVEQSFVCESTIVNEGPSK